MLNKQAPINVENSDPDSGSSNPHWRAPIRESRPLSATGFNYVRHIINPNHFGSIIHNRLHSGVTPWKHPDPRSEVPRCYYAQPRGRGGLLRAITVRTLQHVQQCLRNGSSLPY